MPGHPHNVIDSVLKIFKNVSGPKGGSFVKRTTRKPPSPPRDFTPASLRDFAEFTPLTWFGQDIELGNLIFGKVTPFDLLDTPNASFQDFFSSGIVAGLGTIAGFAIAGPVGGFLGGRIALAFKDADIQNHSQFTFRSQVARDAIDAVDKFFGAVNGFGGRKPENTPVHNVANEIVDHVGSMFDRQNRGKRRDKKPLEKSIWGTQKFVDEGTRDSIGKRNCYVKDQFGNRKSVPC